MSVRTTDRLKAYLGSYDSFERHHLVGSLMDESAASVLDVGGVPGALARFTDKRILVTNLTEGSVLSSGLDLPFADDSFDVVTSVDVLEHIPPAHRRRFIGELLRVARWQVIFCAPYGSPEHMVMERALLDQLSRQGHQAVFLAEHVANGLPHEGDVKDYLGGRPYQTWFTGDFRYSVLIFQVGQVHAPAALAPLKQAATRLMNMLGNVAVYPLTLSSSPRPFANRLTVVVVKTPAVEAEGREAGEG